MQKALGLSAYAGQAFSSLSLRKRYAGLRNELGAEFKSSSLSKTKDDMPKHVVFCFILTID